MKQIFTYENYVRDTAFAERGIGLLRKEGTIGFFRDHDDSICPFCSITMSQVHNESKQEQPEWLGGGLYRVDEYVWSCDKCGWWRIRTNKETDGEIDAISAIVKSAVLKKYDLSSKEIPLALLQNHLRNNYDDVIDIDSKKMEQLVKSVFSEHFSCEVEHIGKSYDGGIDLLLINSEIPTVVQVKRRRKLKHTEAVSGIRELLGATLLKESKNCIYVSTCSKFSEAAEKAATRSVELGHVENFELYDFKRFSDVLKLTKQAYDPPWRKFLHTEP